jgi:hypothetical protein
MVKAEEDWTGPDRPTRFVVAEVSKNWPEGEGDEGPPLSYLFEEVIEHNLRRRYRLHSFQLHRLMTGPNSLNETIIAVFERQPL